MVENIYCICVIKYHHECLVGPGTNYLKLSNGLEWYKVFGFITFKKYNKYILVVRSIGTQAQMGACKGGGTPDPAIRKS